MTVADNVARKTDIVTPEQMARLARHLLKRDLHQREMTTWINRATEKGHDFEACFALMVAMPEYQDRAGVDPGHPPGHYYSPIVNPAELKAHFRVDRDKPIDDLPGLNLRDATLQAEFAVLAPLIAKHRFPPTKIDGERYFTDNGLFPLGDAITLAAMIAQLRPRRILEIGSGFSTACMLDVIEREGLDTRITCVEPYPARLRRTLTDRDAARVTIIKAMAQTTPLDLYDTLDAGDILFIDSTHVAKTGSDVCFEIFEILPRLKPGVIVHIHDIQYPFEYPDVWIFKKRWSWNEIYMIRAFLMYNDRFGVIAFNSYWGQHHRTELEAAYGAPVADEDGSIWLRVLA
jgi:hypothetical protein